MKKLGYLAGASLLFVPMPLYAAGIGSSNQVFTHTGWFSVICMFVWQQSVLELQFVQNIRNNNEKRFNSKNHLGCGPFLFKI